MKTIRLAFSALLIIVIFSSQAQLPRQISVIGKANMAVNPSMVKLTLRLSDSQENYAAAVSNLFEKSNQLTKDLYSVGFDKDRVYTANLAIAQNSKYVDGKQQRAYIASQEIEVQFEFEQERLLSILNTLSVSSAEPEIRFTFDLSQEEKNEIAQKLLAEAVKDARTTAETLAKAAGEELATFTNINYGAMQPPVGPMRSTAMELSRASIESYNPQELTISQQVQVIFLVK